MSVESSPVVSLLAPDLIDLKIMGWYYYFSIKKGYRVLRKQRQANLCEFKTSLGYIVNPRPVKAM